MPSSGARSGTKPSRSERGAGRGKTGDAVYQLRCGHDSPMGEPVITKAGGDRLWFCPEGCGLQERKHLPRAK